MGNGKSPFRKNGAGCRRESAATRSFPRFPAAAAAGLGVTLLSPMAHAGQILSGVYGSPITLGTTAPTSTWTSSVPVSNTGTISVPAGANATAALTAEGSWTISNSGTISAGNGAGIALGGGSLSNTGLISGTTAGVSVDIGNVTITNRGTISGTGSAGIGVLFTGQAQGTIDNFGVISGAGGTAIKFAGGANTLILESCSLLSGAADGSLGANTLLVQGSAQLQGVQLRGFQSVGFLDATQLVDQNSTITNAKVISGTLTNAGTLNGSLSLSGGATLVTGGAVSLTDTSTNSGTITNNGTFSNNALLTNDGTLNNSGSVTNSGTIAGTGMLFNSGSLTNSGTIVSATYGVVGTGQITNSGTLLGSADAGVVLTPGGTLSNLAGGFIEGGTYGMEVEGGVVTNAGTILDGNMAGVSLSSGASLTNQSGGTVGGVTGVLFAGTGSTVVNGGTITGSGGVAVQFDAAGGNSLTLETGAVLNGSIDGGGGSNNVVLNGSGSLANAIANFGAGSALNITGDWALSGNVAIATINVAAGGSLAGTSSITGALTNAGRLIPGGAGTIGTLKVAGNFVQQSTGTLQIALNPAGSASLLHVSGTAQLAGNLLLSPIGTGFTPGSQYTVLVADGGVSGTFAGVSADTAFLTTTLEYGANSVIVDVGRKAVSFSSVANTSNQRAAATALQSLAATSALSAAILPLSAEQARGSFDALSGEIYASLPSALIDDTSDVRDSLLRDGQTQSEGLGFWGDILDDQGKFDNRVDVGSDALQTHRQGVIAGLNFGHEGLKMSVVSGYSDSSYDADGRGSASKVKSYYAGGQIDYRFGALRAQLGGLYSWHHIATNRIASFPGFDASLLSDQDAHTEQGFAEIGYSLIDNHEFRLEPFAGYSHIHAAVDPTSESGGVAALQVARTSRDVDYLRVGFHLNGSAPIAGTGARFEPKLTLAWQHGWGDRSGTTTMTLDDGASFDVAGSALPKDAARIEGGFDVVKGVLRFSVAYVGTVGGGQVDHGAMVNVGIQF